MICHPFESENLHVGLLKKNHNEGDIVGYEVQDTVRFGGAEIRFLGGSFDDEDDGNHQEQHAMTCNN